MKKILIITMLFTVACVSSSYKDNNTDKQLAQNLKGTWEGSVYIEDEEIPTDYQFFESADGTTGKFVEIAYMHEYDGDFDIRYFAYSSGEYSVKDGRLSLTYYPESTYAEAFDEQVIMDYAAALMEYYRKEGKELFWEDEAELAESILDILADEWTVVCEERNEANETFGNLTFTGNKMSFVSGKRTLEFKLAENDWFTAFPFSE